MAGGWRNRLDSLREQFESILTGRAPSDPLYLTNRTWRQKLKTALLIALAAGVLLAVVAIGVADPFGFRKVDAYDNSATEALSPAPKTQPLEPILSSEGLEVVNIRIDRAARPPVVTGIVRNNSERRVKSAEVRYYLGDAHGSVVGGDTAGVSNVAPHGSAGFRVPLKTAQAEYVLVRDVHPN